MKLILILFAFFLGSLPFGLYVARTFKGIDPREGGSRNTGATNVARLCGTKYGITVLALDLLKGFLPVVMAAQHGGWLFTSLVMLAAVFGHAYSPFLGWKGGKAVATSVGVFLGASFWIGLIASAACIGAVLLSGYVSMGSLTFAVMLPVLSLLSGNIELLPVSLIIMLLIFWKHRENIQRLSSGQEKPWRRSKYAEGEEKAWRTFDASDEDK